MAMIEWFLKGREFGNCNCSYGCPCQFNALPTHGNCMAMCAYRFDEGRFGDVDLVVSAPRRRGSGRAPCTRATAQCS